MKLIKFLLRNYAGIGSGLLSMTLFYFAGIMNGEETVSRKLHWFVVGLGVFFLLITLLVIAVEVRKITATHLFDVHALPKNMTYIVEHRKVLNTLRGYAEVVIVRAIEINRPDMLHTYRETGETSGWNFFGKSLTGKLHQFSEEEATNLLSYRNEDGTGWDFDSNKKSEILEILSKYEQ